MVAAGSANRRFTIVVIMGVAGSGKSSVGEALARALGCPFLEGDSLHSAANVARMSAGIALTDEDRADWLAALADRVAAAAAACRSLVLSCSALKRRYRDQLRGGYPLLLFVHLEASKELIRQRVSNRQNHFMPASLIESQFAALEPPGADEARLACPAELTVDRIVERIVRGLRSLAEK